MPQAVGGQDTGDTFVYTVPAAREAVQDYYAGEMSRSGWNLVQTEAGQNSLMLTFDKEGNIVGVSLEAQGDGTRVKVIKMTP